jgi:hypothetical protein
MNSVARMVLAILGVYRLAHMIANETGPAEAFYWLRGAVAQRWPGRLINEHEYMQSWQEEGISCPLCLSFWLALPAAAAVAKPSKASDLILRWLGIAGAALGIHKAIYRKG